MLFLVMYLNFVLPERKFTMQKEKKNNYLLWTCRFTMVWPNWVLKSLTVISGLWSCWKLFCFAFFFLFSNFCHQWWWIYASYTKLFSIILTNNLRIMHYFLQLYNWTGSCSPLYDCDCFSVEIGAEAYYWGTLLLSFQSVGSMLYLVYLPNH